MSLDKFLAFGETFDWVTPLIDLYKDLSNGPSQELNIDRYCGWSANKIRRLLKKAGVKSWGLTYTDDLIIFLVKQPQAQLAKTILRRENISH